MIFGYDGYIYMRNIYSAFFPKRTPALEASALPDNPSAEEISSASPPVQTPEEEIPAASPPLEPDNSIHTT
jgi:hypothetical protein